MTSIEQLRALAEAAQRSVPTTLDAAERRAAINAEFREAANPATILALLDRVERAERDLQYAVVENQAFNVRVATEINEARSQRDAAIARAERAERERDALAASASCSSRDSQGMTNNELAIKLQLSERREKQATEMCTWLTAENQRLRDALAIADCIDDEIDGLLEDSEETTVENAQLQNQVLELRARYEKAHADCNEMIRLHDEVEKERDAARQECTELRAALVVMCEQFNVATAECERLKAQLDTFKKNAAEHLHLDMQDIVNGPNSRANIERDTASAIADFVEERLDWDRSDDTALYAIAHDIRSGAWRGSR